MTAQHKSEKAARQLAFATALANWQRLDETRSKLGSAMRLATIRYQHATPTAAPLVIQETQN